MFGDFAGICDWVNQQAGNRSSIEIGAGDRPLQDFSDRKTENPIVRISGDKDAEMPSLYELIRLVRKAATDSSIRGIYLKCNSNANGFASSEELRNVLVEFKKNRKFILAYGDYISQKAYYVANVADKIYCNPKGSLDWKGFTSQLFFIKQTLQKLEIQPQIFYDGKSRAPLSL